MQPFSKEEVLLTARLRNLIRSAQEKNYPRFSHFLDETGSALAQQLLREEQAEQYAFFGGFSGARRQMLGICPDYLSPEQLEFPIAVLRFSFSEKMELTHRDVLGSLMSLGIKRETVGDIVLEPGTAYAAVCEELADWALQNITRIGRVGVQTQLWDGSQVVLEQKYRCVGVSVASLRLDAVVAAALPASRTVAAELIQAGKVLQNGLPQTQTSRMVSLGDTITVRGKGKFLVGEKTGQTRRGRIHLEIKHFISCSIPVKLK